MPAVLLKIEQWSLSRQEKGPFGATDDTAAAATFSSAFEPSVYICTYSGCLDVIFKKACLYTSGFIESFFIFCQRQTDLRFRLTPRRGICHFGVSSPLSDITTNSVNHQLFTDDTQPQKSTPPNDVQSPFITGRMFVRRTMIRFLIELLVRRIWFGQSKLYFILNWLEM